MNKKSKKITGSLPVVSLPPSTTPTTISAPTPPHRGLLWRRKATTQRISMAEQSAKEDYWHVVQQASEGNEVGTTSLPVLCATPVVDLPSFAAPVRNDNSNTAMNSCTFKNAMSPSNKSATAIDEPSIITTELPRIRVPAGYDFPLSQYRAPQRPRLITRKHHNWRRRSAQAAGFMMICVVAFSGFIAWRGYTKMSNVFKGTDTVAALQSDRVAPQLLKGEGSGRVNILLLGVGGKGHDGADLTDTMMVMSIDPVNHSAALLSIPRDMWVRMPVKYFGEQQKINAAYSAGKYKNLGKTDTSNANRTAVEAGFAAADTVVTQVTGLAINYHVLVDFKAFQQAIDTVGGVTVDVTEELRDRTMAWENNGQEVLAPLGVQVMDGRRALMYARSRETTSDFSRSERQRKIMLALKDKVVTGATLSSPTKVEGLMNAFGENVYTDLSVQAAMRLAAIARQIKDTSVASLNFTTAPNNLVVTDQVRGLSIVRPRTGLDNYSEIQNYIRSQLRDGYLAKEDASLYVVSNTSLFAQNMVATLQSQGYKMIGHSQSTHTQNQTSMVTVVDLSDGRAPYTRHYLENRYSVKAVSQLPSGVQVPSGIQFAILVNE